RACLIQDDAVLTSPLAPGDPRDPEPCAARGTPAPTTYEGESTTHLTTADRWGNVVAYTLTIEQTGGSGITVPGRGFLLNNELTDFSFAPADPAVHDPNLPGPGKRPRSSISPTIVLDRHDRPVVALGSPGGSTIITTVLQTLTGFLDRGLPLADAIAAPRASQRNTARTAWRRSGSPSPGTRRSAPPRPSNACPAGPGSPPPNASAGAAVRPWWSAPPARPCRHQRAGTTHLGAAGPAPGRNGPRPASGSQLRCRGLRDAEGETPVLSVDRDPAALPERAVQEQPGQLVVDLPLDGAAQRPGPVLRLVAAPGQPVHGRLGELHADALALEPATRRLQQQVGDQAQFLRDELAEHHHLVDPVEELGPEVLPQRPQDLFAPRLLVGLRAARREPERRAPPGDRLRAEVAGHHDDRVGDVHGPALRVGQPAVVEDLQQDVEDVRVGLLHLVEQQQRVRVPPHHLGQLPGLLVADVPGRRAHQPADGVPLLVLAHVEPHHPVVAAEQRLGERAGQFGLADAGGAEEQEAADRPVRAGEPGAGAQHRVRDDPHGLVLADDPLVQVLFELKQPGLLLLGEAADRDAGLPGNHLGDRLRVHDQILALVHLRAAAGLLDAVLQLRDAVPQLSRPLVLLVRDRLVLVAGQ